AGRPGDRQSANLLARHRLSPRRRRAGPGTTGVSAQERGPALASAVFQFGGMSGGSEVPHELARRQGQPRFRAGRLPPHPHYPQNAQCRAQGLLLGRPQETGVGTPELSRRRPRAEQYFGKRAEGEISPARMSRANALKAQPLLTQLLVKRYRI